MKACVITDRRRGFNQPLPKCDVALFGFGAIGEVNFAAELDGKSDKLERLSALSSAARCGVTCGCFTDSRGLKRKSVAVACEGKLLGITDMLYVTDGEEFKSGATAGVYSVRGYRIGVCIENDLRFPELINAFSLCGCNLVCAYCENAADGISPTLIRAYAYLYGVPIVMSAGSAAFFADITGVIASSNRDVTVFETSPRNSYRVITSRRRGLFGDSAPDF